MREGNQFPNETPETPFFHSQYLDGCGITLLRMFPTEAGPQDTPGTTTLEMTVLCSALIKDTSGLTSGRRAETNCLHWCLSSIVVVTRLMDLRSV